MAGEKIVARIDNLHALKEFADSIEDKPVTSLFGGRYYQKSGTTDHVSLNVLIARARVLANSAETDKTEIGPLVQKIEELDRAPVQTARFSPWKAIHWIRQLFSGSVGWREKNLSALKALDPSSTPTSEVTARAERAVERDRVEAAKKPPEPPPVKIPVDKRHALPLPEAGLHTFLQAFGEERVFVKCGAETDIYRQGIEKALNAYASSHQDVIYPLCVLVKEGEKTELYIKLSAEWESIVKDIQIRNDTDFRQDSGSRPSRTIPLFINKALEGFSVEECTVLRPQALFPPKESLSSPKESSDNSAIKERLEKIALKDLGSSPLRLSPEQAVLQRLSEDPHMYRMFYREGKEIKEGTLTFEEIGFTVNGKHYYRQLPGRYTFEWLDEASLKKRSTGEAKIEKMCLSATSLDSLEAGWGRCSLKKGEEWVYIHHPSDPDSGADYVLNVLSQGADGKPQIMTATFKVTPEGRYKLVEGSLTDAMLQKYIGKKKLQTEEQVKAFLKNHSS